MVKRQAARTPSRFCQSAAKRFALRLACCFSCVLVLYGCSTPQAVLSPPQNEAPPVSVDISAPRAEIVSAPVAEERNSVPVAEEDNVVFPLRSALVGDTEKEKLRQYADRLKSNRQETVLLEAHTDDQGSRSYNLAITEERLVAVEKLLRRYGVSARQIRRQRSGRVRDSMACATLGCRQQMRSVELHYSR